MQKINVLRLVCLNVLVIDSLRNLPIIAHLGSNLLIIYLVAAAIFLIPVAQISRRIAEIGIKTGGASIYEFTQLELGSSLAKAQSLLLWGYNVFWYPTLLLFLGTLLHPVLKAHISAHALSILLLAPMFLLSIASIRLSSSLSAILAFFGAILPMTLLAGSAYFKIFSHPHAPISFFMPNLSHLHLTFIPTVFFSLMGIELATMHSKKLMSKHTEWRVALWISIPIIIFLLVGCGLAIWEMGTQQGFFIGTLVKNLMMLFSFVPIPHFTSILIYFIAASILAQVVFWMQATAVSASKAISGNTKWKNVKIALSLQTIIAGLLMMLILFSNKINNTFMFISNLSAFIAIFYYIILMLAYRKYAKANNKGLLLVNFGLLGMLLILFITALTLILPGYFSVY